MPSSPDSLASSEAHRDRLKLQLAVLNDLRPGSLVERYRKCGKPGCRCAQPGAMGHGPSYSLNHGVAGKTVTKIIPANYVEQTRKQLLEHRAFPPAFSRSGDGQRKDLRCAPARLRIGRRYQKNLRSPLIWRATSALKSMHSSGAESHRSWI